LRLLNLPKTTPQRETLPQTGLSQPRVADIDRVPLARPSYQNKLLLISGNGVDNPTLLN
jgi:hypothetical protein